MGLVSFLITSCVNEIGALASRCGCLGTLFRIRKLHRSILSERTAINVESFRISNCLRNYMAICEFCCFVHHIAVTGTILVRRQSIACLARVFFLVIEHKKYVKPVFP